MTATTAGPTQGAERHADAVGRWKGRPGLARALRVLIVIAPLIASVLYTWLAGKFIPAERLGLGRWTWIGLIFVTANLLLAVLRRLTARLLPLVALMKLTLVFPDQAPSRMKATLRQSNSRKLLRNITEAKARGEKSEEIEYGDYLLQLLKEVNEHDRLTRGHSERVRVYSEMLGEEIGLSDDDMNKLRWSALLHDVGKLTVPSEILNGEGRPTEEQWKILSGHPAAARPMLEPLRPWLGDWIHSADQHHCRWDGSGYPEKLAGTDISLAGRLVAIADAYDVMTSARSYKKPLSVELARQELTDCAGSQFDPNLVRSFLRISLGRLRTVGGPLAWLANLTGSAQLPVPIAGTVTTGAWSAGVASAGMVVAATAGIVAPLTEAPEFLAFSDPVVAAYDQSATTPEDEAITIWLGTSSTNGAPIVTVSAAAFGTVVTGDTPVRSGQLLDRSEAIGDIWQTAATYTPDPGFVGEDVFEFGACLDNGLCSIGRVTIDVLSSNQSPISSADQAQVLTGQPVGVDVLLNDVDPDSDVLTIVSVGTPSFGQVRIVDNQVEYTPNEGFEGSDTFEYTVTDDEGATSTSTVTVTVQPVIIAPARPTPTGDGGDGFETLEDTTFTTPDVTLNDDLDGLSRPLTFETLWSIDVLTSPTNGALANNGDGTFTYAPNANFNGTDEFSYVVTTPEGFVSNPVPVTLTITAVDDPPVTASDSGVGFTTNEDEALTTGNVTDNDVDPDGPIDLLGVSVVLAPANGEAISNGDGTFTYTPASDFNGSDSFSYSIIDGAGLSSNTADVTISVTSVNDAPIAVDDEGPAFTTSEDTPLAISELADNDTDVEDDELAAAAINVVETPAQGALSTNDDGTLAYEPAPNFNGTDTFTYTIADSDGLVSEAARVTLTILAVNDAPDAVDDGGESYATDEDTALTTPDVTINDTDVEDGAIDAATAQVSAEPDNGTLTNNGDGTFDYEPDADFNGADTFAYTVTDSAGLISEEATVTVTVGMVNDAPVATDDFGAVFTTDEDTTFTLPDITLNDTDLEDGPTDRATIAIVTDVTNGTLTRSADDLFTYAPDADFNGTDEFTYTVTDSLSFASNPATVTITVDAVNDAPDATDDAGAGFATDEDTPFTTAAVTANDSDLEDGPIDPQTVAIVDGPSAGTVTNNADGTFTYSPFPDAFGADSFTYTVTDADGLGSEPATVTISIVASNDAPVAVNDDGLPFSTPEDAPFTLPDFTANDTDVEDGTVDRATVTIETDVANGTLTRSADDLFDYAPDGNFNGTDSFTYTVLDRDGLGSNPATVTITVRSGNDPPVALDDAGAGFVTSEDTPFTTTAVTTNDSDIEDGSVDPSTVTVIDDASHGTLINNLDGTFGYTPNADFNGTDAFTYAFNDSGLLLSSIATVTITVTPVNDAPVAADDDGAAFTTPEDTGITTPDVTANDADVEDGAIDAATVTVIASVTNGLLDDLGNGTFDYTPAGDFTGADSFTYTVTDSDGSVSQPATVTFTVTAVNDVPIAANDGGVGYTTPEDTPFTTANVTANDSDIEDGTPSPASVAVVTDVVNGTLTNNGDGTFDYAPGADFNGTDTFTYTVTDSGGATSAPAQVSITVTAGNDAPVSVDDAGVGYGTAEDTPFTTADVTANDSDIEDAAVDPSTVTVVTDAVNGTLTYNNDGTFTYEPDAEFNGTDSFTYQINDSGLLLSNTATVTLVITAVNDAPVANDDSGAGFDTVEDTPFTTADVTSNDFDVEDGAARVDTVSIVQDAAGSLTNNGDGTFGYTPDPDFDGVDTFVYTITDDNGVTSGPAKVTITVTPVNDAPVAVDDNGPDYTVEEDGFITTPIISANDSDVEDGVAVPATITIVTDVANGTLINNADGRFTYTPNPDFFGSDSFTYSIADSDGLTSNTATVSFTVNPINDTPVAIDDRGVGFITDEDTPFTTADVAANDTDVEDGVARVATISILDNAAGSLTNNGDGTFSYVPNAEFNGIDLFTYTITDDDGITSVPATVTITVLPINDAPVAGDDNGPGYATTEDTTFITPNVTVNDSDVEDGPADPATVTVVTDVVNGTLIYNDNGTFTYVPNPEFNGTEVFTYAYTDSDLAISNAATVTLTVAAVNDVPVAIDDAGAGFSTDEDTPFTTANVTANDSDVEDGAAKTDTVSIVSDAAGTLGNNGDGTFDYSPGPDYNGTDEFTYTITDDDGVTSEPATVTIIVNPVNDAPLALDDGGPGFVTAEDTTFITPDVTANDGDAEDEGIDPATITVQSGPSAGTLLHLGDGRFRYAPFADATGQDSFTYTITDADGVESAPATVIITITTVNDEPIARDDAFVLDEDTTFTTPDVTVNDSDIEDVVLDRTSVALVSSTSNGSLVPNFDGTFAYTPNADFNGTDEFTYTVTDTDGLTSDPATVVLTITSVNDAPVAIGESVFLPEDATVTTGDVTANDDDVEDGQLDPASAAVVADVTFGTLVNNGNGTFTYTPEPDFNGTDEFTYTVTDSDGLASAPATVAITVTALNDTPEANNDSGVGFTTSEDTDFITVSVIANDFDAEDGAVDPATITVVQGPSDGSLTNNGDGTFGYVPDANFFGDDTFTYTVVDAAGILSSPATVTITVTAVNDPPVALDDGGVGFTTPEDVVLVTTPVTANDTDVEDGSGVAGLIISNAAGLDGTLTNNGNGTFTFNPAANFNGMTSFTYTIVDSGGATSNSATVTITVTAGNDAPTAGDDAGAEFNTTEDTPFTTADVTINDGDLEDGPADPSSVSVVDDATKGTLIYNGNGTFTYVPNDDATGTDSFTYTINDSGLLLSNAATVTIQIAAVNDAPVAVDDSGPDFTTDEDSVFVTPSVIANDSDAEDGAIDPATITIVAPTSNGSLVHNGDGTFTYTPNANYFGDDSFAYAITDSDGIPAQGTVSLVVGSVNDQPVANNDSFNGVEDMPMTFQVLSNDVDLEDGPQSASAVTVVDSVTTGVLINNGGGSFTFTPAEDANGAQNFTYRITDSGGFDSDVATVSLIIDPENDAPEAVDDAFTVDEDASITTTDVTLNDLDVEDLTVDPTTVTVVNGVADGDLTDNGDGTFTYEPAPDFNGTDSFTYTVTDLDGVDSGPATVTFAVTPVNDAPVVVTPSPQMALLGTAFSLQIVATDVDLDTLTFTATGLPTGIDIHGGGLIAGTPSPSAVGDHEVTVTVADNGDPQMLVTVAFKLKVEAWQASATSGDIVITEILYLGTKDPTQEFVEVYNAGTTDVDLTGWTFADSNLRVDGAGDVAFVVPATDASGDPSVLEPGRHAVLWLAWDGEMTDPNVGLEYVINNGTRKLNNNGDDMWLVDQQGGLVDYMAYGDGPGVGTPPPAALGMWDDTYQSTLTTPNGTSLSLTPHGVDGNTSACWEQTGSDDAEDRCPDALPTSNADNSSVLFSSVGNYNNVFDADAGGSYAIAEGDDLILDASGTPNSPSTWEWDLDGDGNYDDATGPTPVIPWEKLLELGIGDDGSYKIRLSVDGGKGRDAAELTITNVEPDVITGGEVSAVAGGAYVLHLFSEDAGDDTISSWTINWGDGSIETVTGNPSSVTHTYDRVGFTFNILVAATDEDGTYLQNDLLVPSYDQDKIFRFEATSGDHILDFNVADEPVDVEIGPDGLLYVSSDVQDDVRRYNTQTGAYIDDFVPSGAGGLDASQGLVFGPAGDLYVADYQGDKVLQFDSDTGTFVKVFVSSGLDGPYDIIFGPDSNMYVGNYKSHKIKLYDGINGAVIETFVDAEDGGLKEPEQMTFGPDGHLYISSYNTHEVLRFDGTTGDFIDIFVPGGTQGILDRPTGLAFGPDGHLYVGDYNKNTVRRYDGVTGTYIDDYVPVDEGGLSKPAMITFVPSVQVTVTN